MRSSAQILPLGSSRNVKLDEIEPYEREGGGEIKCNTSLKKTKFETNVAKLLPMRVTQQKELGTKIKTRKDPIPMKLRALPKSFWQQPNHPTPESPASILPPLTNLDSTKEVTSGHPVVVSKANTDLLFSLFRSIDDNNKKSKMLKRGRPKKLSSISPLQSKDEDPCLVSTGILPSLSPTHPKPDHPKNENYSQMLNELVIQL